MRIDKKHPAYHRGHPALLPDHRDHFAAEHRVTAPQAHLQAKAPLSYPNPGTSKQNAVVMLKHTRRRKQAEHSRHAQAQAHEQPAQAGDNPAGRATRALRPRKPEKDARIDDFNSTPGSILLRVAGLLAAKPRNP